MSERRATLLIEDDAATREFLAGVVAAHPELRLVDAVATLAEALASMRAHQPTLLLVDLGLPDGDGLDLIRAAARFAKPKPEIMVISAFGDEASAIAAIEAGAGGYLLKGGSAAELASSLSAMLAGEAPISPAIAAHLLKRFRKPAPVEPVPRPVEPLTDREVEVLRLIAKGFSYAEVATELSLKYNTVASYVKSIYGKLAVHSRGKAVHQARLMGFLTTRH